MYKLLISFLLVSCISVFADVLKTPNEIKTALNSQTAEIQTNGEVIANIKELASTNGSTVNRYGSFTLAKGAQTGEQYYYMVIENSTPQTADFYIGLTTPNGQEVFFVMHEFGIRNSDSAADLNFSVIEGDDSTTAGASGVVKGIPNTAPNVVSSFDIVVDNEVVAQLQFDPTGSQFSIVAQ